jgi:hypothetical protein
MFSAAAAYAKALRKFKWLEEGTSKMPICIRDRCYELTIAEQIKLNHLEIFLLDEAKNPCGPTPKFYQ